MQIALYCLSIAVVSLVGGLFPLARRISHVKLQVYLSLSAGAMLGAAFFHMLPESAELAGRQFGLWTALGVIGLYVIERFVSPHSHDTPDQDSHESEAHHHEHDEHGCSHAHEPMPAAPTVAGWSAVAGLTIHTLLGGIALGSAVLADGAPKGLGLAVFLATILHKPADAFTISTLLVKGRVNKKVALAVQIFFATLIPLGVLVFYFGRHAIAGHLDSAFTGCVLAFSSGTFLCIALSDLLPEVQFHSHDRTKLFAAVLAGAALMWATALFEPEHAHSAAPESGHDHATEVHEGH